jgi:hypothetical protein
MRVPCPRGSACSGGECFHSRTQDHPPSYIEPRAARRVVSALVGKYFDAKYEIYQCAACGARVVFLEYDGPNGHVCERLGHYLG